MNRKLGGFWLAGASAAFLFGACVPTISEVGSLDDSEGGQGGDGSNEPAGGSTNHPGGGSMNPPSAGSTNQPEQCTPGASQPAPDGCNSCTCTSEGTWACTDIACQCEEGAMRPAGDGCNTCQCLDGRWACTLVYCATCTPGETMGDDCTNCLCTDFGDGPEWACTASACEMCVDGEQRPANDECNTCVCENGLWLCTEIGCPQCTEGQMRPAGDDCNTCRCSESEWICTRSVCDVPCDEGFADCDGDRTNGCETNLVSSAANCGACGNVCTSAGATSTCEEGFCAVGDCIAGYDDCNGDPDDGCEAPVGEGGCGDRCEAPPDSPDPQPSTGTCNCPEGMGCVIGSIENPDGEYCFPLPEPCPTYGTCDCLASCVCEGGPDKFCREEMALGEKMNVYCNSEYGVPID